MGGKTVELVAEGVPIEVAWAAGVQAAASLGYTILHSDSASKMLSFNTGRSMSSFAGQDLSMTLREQAGVDGTIITMGGSLGKGGNPFGGGSQLFAWGEKEKLIRKFLSKMNDLFPALSPEREPAPQVPAPMTPATYSVADELTKLAKLRDAGVLTQEEFDAQKARLLA